jgi:hypothetical protein
MLLGTLLAVLAGSMWLSALGVLTAMVGVATLVVAPIYARQQEDVTRRAILPSVFLGVIAVMAIFLWFQHPVADVELKRIDAKPGSALVLSGVDLEKTVPSIEGSFASMGIVESNPPGLPNDAIDTGAFHIRVPVASSACGRLEAELGGSCTDRPDSQLTDFHALEIRTLDPDAALSTGIRLENARTIELTRTTRSTQQVVPTEWGLTQDSPRLEVDIQCIDRAPLALKTILGRSVRADCALDGPTFQLAVAPAPGTRGSLFLRGVGELSAHVWGDGVETIVEKADLLLDGSREPLPELPAPVVLHTPDTGKVKLTAEQSTAERIDEVSISSASVSSAMVGDEERVQNWLQRNVELAYLIGGIVLAMFAGALLDLIFVRLRK